MHAMHISPAGKLMHSHGLNGLSGLIDLPNAKSYMHFTPQRSQPTLIMPHLANNAHQAI